MIEFEKHRSDKIRYFYTQLNVNLEFQRHNHRSFEFIFVNKGEINCEIDGQNFRIHKNEGALILPGQVHSYKTDVFSDTILFVFSSDWINDFYNEIREMHFEKPVCNFLTSEFLDVLQDKKMNNYMIKSVLYSVCSRIYQNCKLVKNSEIDYALTNSIAFYIQDNYMNKITLKDVAENLGYNYYYISSFFNKHFGVGFSDYVNSYRIQYAKAYLINTNKKMTEIAHLCGFDTIRNFNRIFKQEFQMTPNEFRKQNTK